MKHESSKPFSKWVVSVKRKKGDTERKAVLEKVT